MNNLQKNNLELYEISKAIAELKTELFLLECKRDDLIQEHNRLVEEPKPQTIYAGTEDRVEFFKEIAEAFGIEEKLYVVDLVDGEYEISIN